MHFCYGLRPHLQGTASYISLFLQTSIYRDHVSELSAGVNINNLRREHIEGVPLPVAPLNEQRRIVAKIEELFSELDKGVESLKTARAKLMSIAKPCSSTPSKASSRPSGATRIKTSF